MPVIDVKPKPDAASGVTTEPRVEHEAVTCLDNQPRAASAATLQPIATSASPAAPTTSPASVAPDAVPLVAPIPTSISNVSNMANTPSGSRPSSYLSTSRPAPASPASSRPTSVHLSRTRSGSGSSGVERSASNGMRKSRPRSSLGMDVATATAGPSSSPAARLIIRDFGFDPKDARFNGDGPDAQGNKTSYAKPEDESHQASSRGGWGGLMSGWRGLRSRFRGDEEDEDQEASSDAFGADEDDVTFVDIDDDDDELSNTSSQQQASPPSGPDPSGWHRAMYAFEPMGEHEMGLVEGEVVDVLGRGGGTGWVVAVKRSEPRKEGLVPEGYLRCLQPGEEDEVWVQEDEEDEGLGLNTSG